MKKYESTATVRKDLVKKLAEITGQKPKYSGMPKCEYQLPGFIIDRRGDLLAEDDAETEPESVTKTLPENTLEITTETREEASQEAEQMAGGEPQETIMEPQAIADEPQEATESTEEPEMDAGAADLENAAEEATDDADGTEAMEAEGTAETQQEPDALQTTVNIETEASADDAKEADETAAEDGIDLSQPFCLPLGKHNGVSLRNLINLFYSRGPLLGKATGGRFRVSEGLVRALKDDSCTYSMANFRKALWDYEGKNGDSGMEGVGIMEDRILISGFPTAPDLEHYTAWGQLAVLMNNQALTQNRIRAKMVNDENEKYSIRVWMVRLGMNGDSFRQTRKILMENLSGHAAFRTGEQADAFKKKEKRKRDALKAAKAAEEASGHQVGNRDGDSGELQAESRDAAEAAD